jgi:hypothetical protein
VSINVIAVLYTETQAATKWRRAAGRRAGAA